MKVDLNLAVRVGDTYTYAGTPVRRGSKLFIALRRAEAERDNAYSFEEALTIKVTQFCRSKKTERDWARQERDRRRSAGRGTFKAGLNGRNTPNKVYQAL